MVESITRLVQPFVKINKNEWPKVLLMFFYFFLVIATYYIIKPVRSSLFLVRLGPENLPYVYIGEAVIVGIVSFFYAKFVDRHKKENILLTSTVIFSACLYLFWFLFRFQAPWFAFIFYLWSAVFSVMAVTQFWLLSNDLFNPREAKRLFGIIGSGGVLGAICGGYLTSTAVHHLGTENLLLVAGSIILVCVLFIKIACRYEPSEIKEMSLPEKEAEVETGKKQKTILAILKGSSYLVLILILVGAGKVLATFVDFQFQSVVNESFQSKDSKTAFFGGFFAALNGVAFLIQVFVTPRILKRFGVGFALLLLPLGLTFGFLGLVLVPVLWVASFTKFYDGSLNYSIHSASREILYLPVDRTERHKIKPFIDMFIYRFAKGVGGLLILILITVLGLSIRGVSLFALLIVAAWILVILLLKREYFEALKKVISKHSKDSTGETGISEDQEILNSEPILDKLRDEDLKRIFQDINDEVSPFKKRFLDISQISLSHSDYEVSIDAKYFIKALYEYEYSGAGELLKGEKQPGRKKEEDIEKLILLIIKEEIAHERANGYPDEWYLSLRDCIQNKNYSESIRRKAIEALVSLESRMSRHILLERLDDFQESLRFEVIKGLNKLRQKEALIDLPDLRKQLVFETERHIQIQAVMGVFGVGGAKPKEADEALFESALQSVYYESLERIFRLLAFYYPTNLIHLIHDRVKEGDEYVRANAAELLDNLIDPSLEKMLLPIIECEICAQNGGGDREIKKLQLVHSVFAGTDIWLKLLVIFMVSHFKMDGFYGDVQRASEKEKFVVKIAADLALAKIKGER